MSTRLRPGLYAITDNTLTPPSELVKAVEAALKGGAVLVQYRDKQGTAAERFQQASDLVALCRDFGVPLLINDDPELAHRVGAAGVHLGQSDKPLNHARSLLGADAIIGITCHDRLDLAETAQQGGADYLAFGRFYPSTTKPGASAASPGILREAKTLGLPVTAIGGITLDNAEPLIQAGADLLAVVGGLFGGQAADVETRAKAFTRLFAQHHPLSAI